MIEIYSSLNTLLHFSQAYLWVWESLQKLCAVMSIINDLPNALLCNLYLYLHWEIFTIIFCKELAEWPGFDSTSKTNVSPLCLKGSFSFRAFAWLSWVIFCFFYDYYKVNHPFEVYHSAYKAPSEPFIYFHSGLFLCHLHDRHKWGQHAITFQKRFIIPWEEVYLDVFS